MEHLLILIIFITIILSIISYTMSRFKKCPPGKIIVVYGQTGEGKSFKIITQGGVFILPIIQDYQYLDLAPMAIDIDLKNALSLDDTRIDVSFMVTIAISNELSIMENAVEKLLGQNQETIQSMAKDIILGQSRLMIAQTNPSDLKKNLDKFICSISQNVDYELKKLGLKLINININSIVAENGKRLI